MCCWCDRSRMASASKRKSISARCLPDRAFLKKNEKGCSIGFSRVRRGESREDGCVGEWTRVGNREADRGSAWGGGVARSIAVRRFARLRCFPIRTRVRTHFHAHALSPDRIVYPWTGSYRIRNESLFISSNIARSLRKSNMLRVVSFATEFATSIIVVGY